MRRRICILWMGVFVLSLLLSLSAEASEADVELLIMDPDPKGVNVQAAPENGEIIRTIPLNPPNMAFRKVRVTEQQGRWLAVELADGTKGWMQDSALGSVSREDAVLKAEPKRDAAEVTKIPDGKYLTLSAVQGNWAKVTYTDEKKVTHVGWLPQAQLETEPGKIPVFEAPKPEVTQVPQVPQVSGRLDLQIMDKSRNTQEITNVRDKPGGKVIASIPRHPSDPEMRGVHITKQEGAWFAVELKDGTKGWMHSSVLGCFAAADAEGGALLFSRPNDKAVTKTRVPENTPLFLTGIQGTWAKIAYTDTKGKKVEGWLPARSQWLDYEW
jgi:SH3-like domain-containing protein